MQPCSPTWLPGNHPELRSYSTSHPGSTPSDARSVPRLTTLSRLIGHQTRLSLRRPLPHSGASTTSQVTQCPPLPTQRPSQSLLKSSSKGVFYTFSLMSFKFLTSRISVINFGIASPMDFDAKSRQCPRTTRIGISPSFWFLKITH